MDRRVIYAAMISLSIVMLVKVSLVNADSGAERVHVGAGSIAAGGAHTALATPDGRVHVWGAAGRGQLGLGRSGDRHTPAEVAGLPAIIAVAAGAAHTVAVSATGEVYAWGANTFGRLGDGTRTRRDRPIKVPGIGGVKTVAAGRAHTLALTVDGGVFAWGLNANGQIGNGRKAAVFSPTRVQGLSDVVAIAAGDAHSLAATRDGRLYAWGSNAFSALGDGTARDREAPVLIGLRDVISVAAGGAHSLALVRSGAVYSWGRGANGQLGTGLTKTASTPRIVAGISATSIAAGRNFSGAVTTTRQALTWGANGSGQLGDGTTTRRLRPVAVSGGDSVASIALGGLHGVAVTLSGDIRTWGESEAGRLGSGALLDQSVPVEIVADVPDWGVEPGDVDPEPIDSIPPTIRAVVSPPLGDGWMTTPVTVSFECADDVMLRSCSAPLTVSQDGVTHVSGEAVDAAGNRAAASVDVSLDLQPPAATIGNAPEAIQAVTISVSGTIVDAASGVVDARCNGDVLTLVHGAFVCSVRLQPGRNDIVVSARDAVGRETSTAATIARVGTPTALYLTPASRTLGLNETSRLTLRDEFGAVVDNAAWSFADENVVSFSADDPSQITAIGLGATTIVAEKDGLRAEALIRVVPALAPGDERWLLPSIPLLSPEPPLFANRVSPDVPHLFAIDSADWDKKVVRGVSPEGEVLWQQSVSGVPFLADAFGGVVAGVTDAIGDVRAFARFGGGTTKPWRYDSLGMLERPAQSSDGTIYAIESVPNGQVNGGGAITDKYAVVIDGSTGRLIARTKLAPEVNQFISAHDGHVSQTVPPITCLSYYRESPPEVVGPFAGADGRGYFVIRRHKIVKQDLCNEPRSGLPQRTIDMGLDLVAFSRTSGALITNIYSTTCQAGAGVVLPCDYRAHAIQLMPDGTGGVVITWQRGTQVIGRSVLLQKSMTRVDADGTVTERNIAHNSSIEMIGQAGMALTYGDGWNAIDVRTGDTKWSGALPNLTPLAARPDGGVAAYDWGTSELAMVGSSGEIESRQPFGLDWRSVHSGGDWIGIKGESIAAVAGSFSDATRYALFDTKTGQQHERKPGKGIFAKSHTVVEGLTAQHVSLRITPSYPALWTPLFPGFLVNRDEFENLFFTIGAGTADGDSSIFCTGTLTKGINRPNDVRVKPVNFEQLPVGQLEEIRLVNDLKVYFDNYRNDLPYACVPETNPGKYNSNSFVSGLLRKAKAPMPIFPIRGTLAPGWPTPVPPAKFDPQ